MANTYTHLLYHCVWSTKNRKALILPTVPDVSRYISDQRDHHRTKTFEKEIIALLEKHEIDFDPKYVFD